MTTPTTYADYLARKTQATDGDGFEPIWMPDFLFDFQAHLTEWAIRQGRSAILADTGLGKAPMGLVWAENVHRRTGKPVLVLTHLAVSFQLATEAQKFGVEAAISRNGKPAASTTITNYDQLDKFDPDDFGGVVCDESSAIKCFDGQRRAIVNEFMRTKRYRLLCTATAAPNDYIELGTSSEALGHLGHVDMLNRFFTNKQKTSATNRMSGQSAEWRFKGHAENEFWRWVASWARAIRRPSDFGFDDTEFILPPLEYRTHLVDARTQAEGTLFDLPARGLREEREETRRTIVERCEAAAALLQGSEPGVAWCHLNDESQMLTNLIDGAVEITGSQSSEEKEEKLAGFSSGDIRVIVIKPKLGAWGLNWQHCNRMTYFPSHSFEQAYQAVRRSWRYGQKRPVTVDIVTTEGGAGVMANLQRKAAQAEVMFDSLIGHMRDAETINPNVNYTQKVVLPSWA